MSLQNCIFYISLIKAPFKHDVHIIISYQVIQYACIMLISNSFIVNFSSTFYFIFNQSDF